MRHTVLKVLHVLALGTWFGGAGFFNLVAAPTIFDSFQQVVHAGPSPRTAGETIFTPRAGASTKEIEEQKQELARALAGSAVGPVFPKYFALQAVCGVIALATASAWFGAGGAAQRWRLVVLALALLSVGIGWQLSSAVSELRVMRFDPNPETAAAAKAAFGSWHLASLGLSLITLTLAGIGLALASKLPEREADASLPVAPGGL